MLNKKYTDITFITQEKYLGAWDVGILRNTEVSTKRNLIVFLLDKTRGLLST